MDKAEAVVQIVNLLVNLRRPPKQPRPDYSEIRKLYKEYYDQVGQAMANAPKFGDGFDIPGANSMTITVTKPPIAEIEARTEPLALPAAAEETIEGEFNPVATSCIACSRSHLVTIAGALEEGLRFARDGGIMHPEAVRRIDASEREITNLERIDLAPDAILASPPQEQELARYFIPKIRDLRQKIGQIASVDQMEQAAADASILSQEFRLRQMQMKGADLNPIVDLAKAVESGEITIEEARERVKQYLPSEA